MEADLGETNRFPFQSPSSVHRVKESWNLAVGAMSWQISRAHPNKPISFSRETTIQMMTESAMEFWALWRLVR